MTKLSLTLGMKASMQRVWDIITHPERYPSFIKGIKKVTILQRNTDVSLAQWTIDVEGLDVHWTEQCHYEPLHSRISFHAIKGDFSTYSGSLALNHTSTGVELTLEATLDWGIPSFERIINKVVEEKVRRSFMGMIISIKRTVERSQPKGRYGFVIHPLDIDLISIAFHEPNLASKRRDLLSKTFEWLPPFKCSDIVGLTGPEGNEVDGSLIYCPLLPEQMVANNGEIALKRTIEAVRVAEEMGARVVGLGAYAANIGRKGILVAEAVRVPVTTGTSYTIATAINGVEEACRLVGADLRQMSLGIVGATGGIGSTCAELLAGKVGSLILNARNRTRLNDLVSRLKEANPHIEISATTELDWLISNSDILITATNSPSSLIDARSVRPGTIICDVSRPRNVAPESVDEAHGSVLVFDGGIVKPPGEVDLDFYVGLPPGLTYACLAETMILALAERYEGYSIGANLSSEKVREVSKLGHHLGFRLAELRWCDREISPETLHIVREHIQRRSLRSKV